MKTKTDNFRGFEVLSDEEHQELTAIKKETMLVTLNFQNFHNRN